MDAGRGTSQTVLVTGANGFVGQALAQQLGKEYQLVRSVRSSEGLSHPERYTVVGDSNSGTRWSEALLDVDIVIHLAARVHVMSDTSSDPLQEYRKCNVEGTLNLARQAAAGRVKRFIYLSTIKVHGEETHGQPFTAEDAPDPVDPYALSKYEAELGLLQLARDTGMEVVIIRAPLIYGPGVKANFYRMMQWLARGIPLPMGAINNKRTLVAIANLVDLIMLCTVHPAAANQIFLAGDGDDLSTTELLRHVSLGLGKTACLFPVPPVLLTSTLKFFGREEVGRRLCASLQVDSSKARKMLGWHPLISVEEGLRVTAEWYQQHCR